MTHLTAAVLAYLLGSVSFAVIVSAMLGLSDPRTYGSGNPGATNVLRSGNKLAAVLTLLGDGFKGWLAVKLAMLAVDRYHLDPRIVALVALAVFVGHLYPVFFRFKGGKGVATAAGVLLAINPILGLATFATWLIVAFFLRYSSLAALACAAFAPFFYVLLFRIDLLFFAILAMSLLLIYRHRGNIRKLLDGTEGRIGQK